MKHFITALFLITIFSGCKETDKKEKSQKDSQKTEKTQRNPAEKLAERIGQTHQVKAFKKEDAVAFNLDLKFGGQDRMKAKIIMATDGSQIKIEKNDSTNLFYGPNGAFLSPKEKKYQGARFDVMTWPYFFALPFKLSDPGTQWSSKKERPFKKDKNLASAKLTFAQKTGDSPDDWYIVYAAENTDFLKAAAYIVTFGTDVEKAEKNPHAIVYDHFITVNDIPVAQQWTFRQWDKERGIYGDPLGSAEITDINYFKPNKNTFKVPENAVKIKKPNL